MKGVNGVQCQVHPEFLKLLHNMQDAWHKNHPNRDKNLSTKRLSLTILKMFNQMPELINMIVNAEINLNEE